MRLQHLMVGPRSPSLDLLPQIRYLSGPVIEKGSFLANVLGSLATALIKGKRTEPKTPSLEVGTKSVSIDHLESKVSGVLAIQSTMAH